MEFNSVRNSSTLAHDAIESIYGMYLSEDKVVTNSSFWSYDVWVCTVQQI